VEEIDPFEVQMRENVDNEDRQAVLLVFVVT